MINASFEIIDKVEKHPNADKLDVVTVSGYTVISQKDTLKVGDLVFFIREDSQININKEKFPWHAGIETYLGKRGRVKTIKLRGIFSSGIVIPYQELGFEKLNTASGCMKAMIINEYNTLFENEDTLNELTGIQHYNPPVIGTSFGNLSMKGNLPYGLTKTDEENWQNLKKLPFGEKVLLTRKIDGTSCTVTFDRNGYYRVCGRNYEYLLDKDNIYINYSKKLIDTVLESKIYETLEEGTYLVIRGEIAGKGIQTKGHNIDCQNEPDFYVFKTMIWNEKDKNLSEMGYYDSPYHFTLFKDKIKELTGKDITTVPVIGEFILTQELIDRYSNKPASEGEGVVVNHKNGSFKIKSLDYISRG